MTSPDSHTTSSPYGKPVRLAAVAYHAALAGKWDTARSAVMRISDECGGRGLMTALIAWCDTYRDHATDGNMNHAVSRMRFLETSTGKLDTAKPDRMPDHVWWAGQLIAARAAQDRNEFQALIAAMPTDGSGIGRHVFAVLECVAMTINGLPRGFAHMGHGAA